MHQIGDLAFDVVREDNKPPRLAVWLVNTGQGIHTDVTAEELADLAVSLQREIDKGI